MVTQILKTMHDTTPPPTQQMCALPVQFLWAASIDATNPGTTTSQLDITLTPVQMDQTIIQWASACYSFYHHSTQPANTIQLPPAIPLPTQQQTQPQATGTNIPAAPAPNLQVQNQGTMAAAQQIIDIQDDDANPITTTNTHTPIDPLLANIVSASVVATFTEQQHQYGHTNP